MFRAALSVLRKTKFKDAGSGTPVVLGLGLLLRDCWRAVEVEPNTPGLPDFLVNSALGHERAEEIVLVIKEILNDLLPLNNQQAEDGAEGNVDLGSAGDLEAKGGGGEAFKEREDGGGKEKEGPKGESRRESRKAEGGNSAVGKLKVKKVTIAPPASPEPKPLNCKRDDSAVRNTRSSRVRKPSKRVLGQT